MVCLLGAECTGKTTMAQGLASHFSSPWVSEYLRDFCISRGRTPTRDEQSLVLETQHINEQVTCMQATMAGSSFVFCDTSPLLTAIYSDYVFGDKSLYDRAHQLHARYALTLLLAPDIAWVADGMQRDGAHVRERITEMIAGEVATLNAPTALVSGQGDARLHAALESIKGLS
jgi:nicotinamide riboside kinase